MLAKQIGASPFIELTWTRATDPDSWQIRRDEEIIGGQSLAGQPNGPWKDNNNVWHWIDYTAAGNSVHHYRIEAKVGGVVSAGSPSYDIMTQPAGVWIGDPWASRQVMLTGSDSPSGSQAEVSAVYYPLRGTDAVRVNQSQRGYEGSQSGQIVGSNYAGSDARTQYLDLMRIRAFPTRTMVVAYANVAFNAILSNVSAMPARSAEPMWDVSFDFEQQGESLWISGDDAIPPVSTLTGTYGYEEGVNLAAVTTSSPGVTSTAGAPVYKSTAAIHGAMGFNSPAAAGGGSLFYTVPYIGMASVYLTPRTATGGGSASSILRLQPIAAGGVAEINLRSAGSLDISNSAGVTQATSNGTAGWGQNKTMRLDITWLWSTGTIAIIVRVYTAAESVYPADEFSASFASELAPARLQVGSGNAAMSLDIDSVRVYAGASTWPVPVAPGTSAEPRWSLPGALTRTDAVVASSVVGVATVDLAYSTTLTGSSDPAAPTYVGAQTVDANGLVRHTLAGLTAGTTYYAKLSTGVGTFVGDLIQWKTLPAAATAFTIKAVVGSCQGNAGGSNVPLAWSDALAWAPDLHFHLGDLGYWGGTFANADDWKAHVSQYTGQITKLPAMRQMMQRSGLYLIADDHEFSANNGDSKAGSSNTDPVTGAIEYTGKKRADSILAMQNAFAMYPLADAAVPASKRGLYGSFMLGSKVRVIMLDGETLDRSLGADTDSGTVASPYNTIPKTFGGAPQDAWLRTQLTQNAAVNLIFTGKTLLGNNPGNNFDKPWAYDKWRKTLNSWIGANTQANGSPIKICWIGGDRHANGYITGAANLVTPGHPSIMASGWAQDSLSLVAGENWTASYGYKGVGASRVYQYVRLTIADNGTNTITLTYLSRESRDQGATIVDGATATFTWTY